MFGLVGIGCFQEDLEISKAKTDVQFKVFESACSDVKTLFPVEPSGDHSLSDEQANSLNDFELGKQLLCHSDCSQYQAVLVSNKVHSTHSTNHEDVADDDDDDSIISLVDSIAEEEEIASTTYSSQLDNEYTVDVVYNHEKFTVFPNCSAQNIRGAATCHQNKTLPFHPNIATIERAFVEDYPKTGSKLPKVDTRCLYVVTKRSDSTLKRFLEQAGCSLHTKSLLILQILEAVAHLERNRVVHRQIDVNNFVVDAKDDTPRVLLTNFAEAFAGNKDGQSGLLIPFEHVTLDTRLMGATLQAPEVRASVPGKGCVVDYNKSDAWNAGLLAFQILTNDTEGTLCYEYKNAVELMDDVANVPLMLKNIVHLLLQDDPNKRLSACEAADILHLELFALPPSAGLSLRSHLKQIRSWMVTHCSEAVARRRCDHVLYDVCRSFFNRMEAREFFTCFRIWMLLQCRSDSG